jgi:hypothetical protein
VNFTTLTWADRLDTRRLLEPIGYVPAVEPEGQCHNSTNVPAGFSGTNKLA